MNVKHLSLLLCTALIWSNSSAILAASTMSTYSNEKKQSQNNNLKTSNNTDQDRLPCTPTAEAKPGCLLYGDQSSTTVNKNRTSEPKNTQSRPN